LLSTTNGLGRSGRAQRVNNLAKHFANLWTQQSQNGNHDDGNQHQHQGILNQPLAFLIM
jgi:hypothetical protein